MEMIIGRSYRRLKTIIYKLFNPNMRGVTLFEVPRIYFKKRLVLGKNISINDNVFIHAKGGIEIGNGTTISHGCSIISTSLDIADWSNGIEQDNNHVDEKVTIGNHVWLCSNSTILPGVSIADDCVIAAGAVVTKTINEPGTMWGGIPAKFIRKL